MHEPLALPIHYNHLVQGAIYNSIDTELAEFLHNKGFAVNGRSFKMFAFSTLNGAFKIDKEKSTITFMSGIRLVITSPVDEFCQSLVNALLKRGTLRLGKQVLEIVDINLVKPQRTTGEVLLRTLSPVVLYSTLLRPDGRKYTAYFQPGDPDHERLLGENLRKKYRAFFREEPPPDDIRVRPKGMQRMRIVRYKGIIIKGYSGMLILKGPSSLLHLAVDAGLGGKNSQGFGCVEVIGNC